MELTDCPFFARTGIVPQNDLASARYDKHPVTPGHLLLVPFRRVASFFEATPEERSALSSLLDEAKHLLDRLPRPDGYNIGVNDGECAGQTIWHLHVHLIPRYRGDVPNPRGGVRGVIPAKQSY
ncbi:MAG TPA: HIT family protein [Burkholderiales bacterium]|nr:HIT family protein [Burkholderiales bacterium]